MIQSTLIVYCCNAISVNFFSTIIASSFQYSIFIVHLDVLVELVKGLEIRVIEIIKDSQINTPYLII